MAQATGYSCDFCQAFAVGGRDNQLPKGWMKVEIPNEQDVRGNVLHICTDKCLRDLGRARMAAAKGYDVPEKVNDAKRPAASPEQAEARREQGRHASHVRLHVNKGVLMDDCKFCDEMTA